MAVVDTATKAPAPAPRPVETKTQRGVFRFTGDSMLFQPCGARELLVYGPPMAIFRVRERFRWVGVWLNTPMFAVFEGAVVVDTPTVKRGTADTTALGQPRTRFLLVDLDTLRTLNKTDCNGMRKR